MHAVRNHALVLDNRTGIDDAASTNRSEGVDDRAGQHNRTDSNRRQRTYVSPWMHKRGELYARTAQVYHLLKASPVIPDRNNNGIESPLDAINGKAPFVQNLEIKNRIR